MVFFFAYSFENFICPAIAGQSSRIFGTFVSVLYEFFFFAYISDSGVKVFNKLL